MELMPEQTLDGYIRNWLSMYCFVIWLVYHFKGPVPDYGTMLMLELKCQSHCSRIKGCWLAVMVYGLVQATLFVSYLQQKNILLSTHTHWTNSKRNVKRFSLESPSIPVQTLGLELPAMSYFGAICQFHYSNFSITDTNIRDSNIWRRIHCDWKESEASKVLSHGFSKGLFHIAAQRFIAVFHCLYV